VKEGQRRFLRHHFTEYYRRLGQIKNFGILNTLAVVDLTGSYDTIFATKIHDLYTMRMMDREMFDNW